MTIVCLEIVFFVNVGIYISYLPPPPPPPTSVPFMVRFLDVVQTITCLGIRQNYNGNSMCCNIVSSLYITPTYTC